jgi:hypothetical protein
MKTAALSIILVTILTTTSCRFSFHRINGNGNVITEKRGVNRAEKIRVVGSLDVFVQSGPAGVRVEADENLLPYIQTNTVDGWLEIKTKDNVNISSSNAIKVYVTTESLSDLSVTGSGNITCNDEFLSSKKTSFEVTGSGNLFAKINAPSVDAEITGSGNLQIAGETRDVDVEINGSGNYRGINLKAENAKIDIAGSGDADVFADNILRADISGSGTVKYKGKANVKSDINGSGNVHKTE